MDNTLQIILKKLDDIESRLKTVESKEISVKSSEINSLFQKAVKIVMETDDDEISTTEMQKKLGCDFKTAEKILDQLAEAGLGETYLGET